jgi:hypothetical protein
LKLEEVTESISSSVTASNSIVNIQLLQIDKLKLLIEKSQE